MKKHLLALTSLGILLGGSFAAVSAVAAMKVTTPVPVVQTSNANVIHLNQADAKQLAKIKGIGKKRAEAIVEYRKQHGKFDSVADLEQVKGISKRGLAKILEKNKVQVGV